MEEKKPVVSPLTPLEDSHGERPVKCTFCDMPAVTVVKGYPVCAQHAEMFEKGEITPPAPPEVGAEPKIAEKS